MSRLPQTILLNILTLCWSVSVVCAAVPQPNTLPQEPIHIEAERMESDQQKEAVLFTGNVEATQGALVIQADWMTVYYFKPAETRGAEAVATKTIDKLRARGNVKIIKEDWLASGDEMEYQTEGRLVVLTGNSKVWQGNNTVVGDRIVLYLDEGKSIVENQSQNEGKRVKAFFYPETDTTDSGNK